MNLESVPTARHSKAQGEASARTLGIRHKTSHNDSLRVDGVSLETDGIVEAMTSPPSNEMYAISIVYKKIINYRIF